MIYNAVFIWYFTPDIFQIHVNENITLKVKLVYDGSTIKFFWNILFTWEYFCFLKLLFTELTVPKWLRINTLTQHSNEGIHTYCEKNNGILLSWLHKVASLFDQLY